MTAQPQLLPEGDTNEDALDEPGTYQGTLPCGDCEGIQTRISLMKNGTFMRTTHYLGKSVKPLEDKGHFSWNDYGDWSARS